MHKINKDNKSSGEFVILGSGDDFLQARDMGVISDYTTIMYIGQ